jgi:Ca2+-binding EF-hand superfamily protein
MGLHAKLGMGVLSLGMMAVPGLAGAQEHRGEDLPNPMQFIKLVQSVGKTVFMAADVNHDDQISQKEAVDAANTVVGGYFFQADRDGNGVVSQEEAKAVSDTFFNQNPWIRYAWQSIQSQQKNARNNTNQANAIQGFETLIDSNGDKQIQATELRQMVQTLTQSVFAAADTNRDGQLNPSEINAAVAGGAQALAQLSFQQADTDNNGSLSRAEYDKAIVEPANVVFQIIDRDKNGEITQQEAQQAQRVVINQVRMLDVPEPPNSLTNLIQSGKTPNEAAPVPTFGVGNPGQSRQQPQTQPRQQPTAPVPPR